MGFRYRLFASCIAIFIAVGPACARDIFILIGQSNMEGRGDAAQLPTFPNNARITAFDQTGWVAAAEPLPSSRPMISGLPGFGTLAPAGAGPGLSFADRMVALRGNDVGLVQCGIGGYSIQYWEPDYRRSQLYGACLHRARLAAADGNVRGFLIFNGESDATIDENRFHLYSPRLSRLVQALRADFGPLPVVYTQLGPEPSGNPAFAAWGGMQLMQAHLSIPNALMVTAADLRSVAPMSPHLDTASYVTLGRRYAEAMHVLLR